MEKQVGTHRGYKIILTHYTGEVLDSQKISSTEVYSRSSRDANGNSYVSSISSDVNTTHEIWLHTSEGEEKSFKVRNRDVPLRVGQKVSIVTLHWEKGKNYSHVVVIKLINHSAGTYHQLYSVKELKLPSPIPHFMHVIMGLGTWVGGFLGLVFILHEPTSRSGPSLTSMLMTFIAPPIAYISFFGYLSIARTDRYITFYNEQMALLEQKVAKSTLKASKEE